MRIARATTTVLEATDDWTIVRIERDDGTTAGASRSPRSVSRTSRQDAPRRAVFGES
jgi:hypothetical protein